jgi:alcohol dehydrogenase class IV
MNARTTWNFCSAGRICFGQGAGEQIPAALARLQPRRVLIVTDQALARAGVIDHVQRPLAQAGLAVHTFDGGEPEPSLKVAAAAVACGRKVEPQVIIGLGGGSNMDLAKITANLLAHGGTPEDYFGHDRIPGPVLPLVCVPTTAGTGSEVSHAAVLTDTDHQMKVSTLSPYLRPMLAAVDPLLTVSCPSQATADAGIDALTHAIEARMAVDFDQLQVPAGESWPYDGRHPLGICLADQAIALVGQHLVTAVWEPENLEAREGMALAATLAGLAFSNCAVAVVHALEYPLGGKLHCSHGAGNGLLLPFVMRYNLPERTATLAHIARLLGEDIGGLSEEQAADRAISAVERLRREIGIPTRIRDLGGTEEQLPEFADKAFAIDRLMRLNPRQPTRDDLLQILRSAF